MGGVFMKPELVLEPGLAQLTALVLIFIATIGVTFAVQASFSDVRALDLAIRTALGAIGLVVLLHPNELVAAIAGIPVLAAAAYWILRRRREVVTEATVQPAK
jgi:hypothetical protein